MPIVFLFFDKARTLPTFLAVENEKLLSSTSDYWPPLKIKLNISVQRYISMVNIMWKSSIALSSNKKQIRKKANNLFMRVNCFIYFKGKLRSRDQWFWQNFIILMCGIKFWKGNENLISVYKKTFFEILSGFLHFWPFQLSKKFIVPSKRWKLFFFE